METFKIIETQEEFEARLTERLAQKERSVAKKYEGYTSPEDLKQLKQDYQTKIDGLNTQIEEMADKYRDTDAKISSYEERIAKYETDSVKTEVAIEMGIPLSLRDRLKGTTKEEILEDAKTFSAYTVQKRQAPLYTEDVQMTQQDIEKAKLDQSYKEFVKEI